MLIPKTLQRRIVAALLNGKLPPGYSQEQLEEMFHAFDEPWRSYLDALLYALEEPEGIQRSSFIASFVRLTPADREAVNREAESEAYIPALDELDPPQIEWLWEGWIPRGMLTVLGAMPSAGKSYLALDLAARVIAGTTFPDGAPVRERGPVIYVDAENVPQLHNRRATAWGMDRSQLYLMSPAQNRLMIDLGDEVDRERLLEWAWMRRPALIVVDSLSAISVRGENNVEDVRDLFFFLSRLALDYGCGMLLIHHLRKPGPQLPLPKLLTFYDLRGSSHIATMSRSIIGLHWVQTGPGQDLNAPRRMEVLKTNLCRYPAPLGVTFRSLAHDPDVAELAYGDVPLASPPPLQAECAAWLLDLLNAQGALPPAQVLALGERQGFRRATIYRARKILEAEVADTHNRHHPANRWMLADAEAETDAADVERGA
jgi:hypothetical protein